MIVAQLSPGTHLMPGLQATRYSEGSPDRGDIQVEI